MAKLTLLLQSEQHRIDLIKKTDITVQILLELNEQNPQQAQQTGATAVKFISTVVNGLNKGTDPFVNLKSQEMKSKAAKILAGISVLVTKPEQVAQYGVKPESRLQIMMNLSKDPAWFKQLEYIGGRAPDEVKKMMNKMNTISQDINTKNTQDLNAQKQEFINLANAWQTVLGKMQQAPVTNKPAQPAPTAQKQTQPAPTAQKQTQPAPVGTPQQKTVQPPQPIR